MVEERPVRLGFAQTIANLIRFLCGALRIFAASALKWPLNAETQRLDGGPQRRFIPKTPFLCKATATESCSSSATVNSPACREKQLAYKEPSEAFVLLVTLDRLLNPA